MNLYGVDYVKFAVKNISGYIIDNEVEFCKLDSIAGNGDFWMSVVKGFRIVDAEIDSLNSKDIGVFLSECGMILCEHCRGASGLVWGAGFKAAAKVVCGKKEVSAIDIVDGLMASAERIMNLSGVKPDDKTLLDTLFPAIQSLQQSVKDDLSVQKLLMKFSEAAMAGAESTKDIIAAKGRASSPGERSLQHPDAGAMALAKIINNLVNSLLEVNSI